MIAFDTDVLTGILLGRDADVARVTAIPAHDQAVPIIVVEEILRGRLNVIRQAEAGAARIRIEQAYALFEETLRDFQSIRTLSTPHKLKNSTGNGVSSDFALPHMIYALPQLACSMMRCSSPATDETLNRYRV